MPEQDTTLEEFEALAATLGVQLVDPEDVEEEREALLEKIGAWAAERSAVDAKIAKGQAQNKVLSSGCNRMADLCKVATRFGKQIPARYSSIAARTAGASMSSTRAVSTNGARYRFEGFGGADRRLVGCTLSRGLVVLTPGCGGAGLDGRLHRAEFTDWLTTLGKALPEKLGDAVEVQLENGKSGCQRSRNSPA